MGLIENIVFPKLPKIHRKLDTEKGLSLRAALKIYIGHPIIRYASKYYLKFLRILTGVKVIAITGSMGKTTTKEMLASILKLDGETVYSFENIDPVYNIPNTILKSRFSTKYLILEMGVEYKNEMDFYLWLAQPDIGVITNITNTHTEFFKNSEGVFEEKRKLVDSLKNGDVAVLNYENHYLRKLAKELNCKVVFFGEKSMNRASNIKYLTSGKMQFTAKDKNSTLQIVIPVLGKQFVSDAMAAIVTSKVLGIKNEKIKKGLMDYIPAKHRMRMVNIPGGGIVLDDSYNNNPTAFEKVIKTLNDIAGRRKKVVVFGDMLELGELEKSEHEKAGRLLAESKLYFLICVGDAASITAATFKKHSNNTKVQSVADWKSAYKILRNMNLKNTLILVKGSRKIALENLVSKLSDTFT